MWLTSTLIAKTINRIIKLLRKGSGNTLPGHVALKIFPQVFSKIKYPGGIILVSGTNGKTTTAKLLTHLLEYFGLDVVTNKSGANLLNGIASTVLLETKLNGRPLGDVAVFEVDEFTLPLVLKRLPPSALVLLNLSRDQLDRYGETDIIFERWKEAITNLSTSTIIVCDMEQKEFHELPDIFRGNIFYFDSDPSNLGKTKLQGSFNAKNINAAILAVNLLGYDTDTVEEGLGDFSVAYGRGEIITTPSVDYQIFLAKNPASFNHNLEILSSDKVGGNVLLFVLNDNIPDGRDVSWIYDVDPDKIRTACSGKAIFVSGTRALDMAIRLKYAGVDIDAKNVVSDLKAVLSTFGSFTKGASPAPIVTVLPNYSAMLETREILIGRRIL